MPLTPSAPFITPDTLTLSEMASSAASETWTVVSAAASAAYPVASSTASTVASTVASAAASAVASTAPSVASTAASVATSSNGASSFAAAVRIDDSQRKDVGNRQRAKVTATRTAAVNNRQSSKCNYNKNSSIVIGKNVNTGVVSWRGADLTVARYVRRVAVGTSADEIRLSLESRGVEVVSLEPILTRHARFSSFKLVIKKSQLSNYNRAGRFLAGRSRSCFVNNLAFQMSRKSFDPVDGGSSRNVGKVITAWFVSYHRSLISRLSQLSS